MSLITDPLFYLVAVPAILIFGMAKGGFGGGVSSLSVPLMALVIDPLTAAAILLPILIAMDAVAVWKFRHAREPIHLQRMLPAALVGIVLASLLLGALPESALRLLIGTIAITFCARECLLLFTVDKRLLSSTVHTSQSNRAKPGAGAGYFWGFIAGFTSTQIHAGGVPASIYLLPQRMDKVRLMGTSSTFFALVNVVKLVPFTMLGQFDRTNLETSLVLMPLAPLGVLLGYKLLHIVDERWIYRILYFFLSIAGGKLIWDGIQPLL